MCKGHIALCEHQAVAAMLCKMAFWLSSKVVALNLDNGNAIAYLCNHIGAASTLQASLPHLECG